MTQSGHAHGLEPVNANPPSAFDPKVAKPAIAASPNMLTAINDILAFICRYHVHVTLLPLRQSG
jgi:hypothetical protein